MRECALCFGVPATRTVTVKDQIPAGRGFAYTTSRQFVVCEKHDDTKLYAVNGRLQEDAA